MVIFCLVIPFAAVIHTQEVSEIKGVFFDILRIKKRRKVLESTWGKKCYLATLQSSLMAVSVAFLSTHFK